MSFPQVALPEEDRLAAIRAQFQEVINEDIDTTNVQQTEQPPPKRGRGRPPGSKNKPKPADFAPRYTDPEKTESLPTLNNPPLTTRDQKEVAKRLAGILEGVTGVASVAKPYLAMTPDEAEAIATPLSTYLIRQEATSGVAKQILEEYDMAAFAIAMAAYVVRVYLDFRAEREQIKESKKSYDRPVVVPANPGVESESAIGSRLDPSTESGNSIPESRLQTQVGEERPVSRFGVSASEGGWTPSQI